MGVPLWEQIGLMPGQPPWWQIELPRLSVTLGYWLFRRWFP